MKTLSYINFALAAIFAACCFYQAVFAIVRLSGKRRRFQTRKLCRYAVLIAARNEQAVIGQLLDSIRGQEYPAELIDTYVVADNCTDSTAQVAASHGAMVYQRQNKAQVGKGFALAFLLGKLQEEHGEKRYDGYFVFDADNLLDPHYIAEMNKVFSSGHRVVTGYRNTKNFEDNWITAGYGLWFLRESEYLNRPRDTLNIGCAVSGTGFLFADSILKEQGGWDWFCLTEDLEFTAEMVIRGEKIAYCGDAVLYDEQPSSFKQSLRQRSRWIKGYFQVIAEHGGDLLHTLTATGRFACYDMLMNTIPAAVLTVLSFLVNTVMFFVGMVSARHEMGLFAFSVISALVNSYGVLFLMGLMPLVTERKRIRCSRRKRVLYAFTFPLFVFTFGIAMLLAVFGNVEWKPIRHSVAVSIGDLSDPSQK
ncbi:glycosyltransferase family 2 protein [Neglectibacter caecimuris]|uniref:glycosyltransferase family 2 protein n=1 Tax=Neglectibacter caecimuris TaxID=3093658 RepID=UPI002AC9A56F|nr:glycosyltransferase family 2 protein [Neglectibacter sp. M00184]